VSDAFPGGPDPQEDARAAHALRPIVDLALDVFVFAPAGALASALDDLPAMAAKGRARVDQELRNAQVVGRFAVDMGLRQLRRRLEPQTPERPEQASAPQRPPGSPAAAPGTPGGGGGERPGSQAAAPSSPGRRSRAPHAPGAPSAPARAPQRSTQAPPVAPTVTRDVAVDRAIPDYDTLSASQVVRRLDGLGAEELRAVERHELAGRGRRTILHRAQQLLAAGPRGPAGGAG
jgi:hypothetical protein